MVFANYIKRTKGALCLGIPEAEAESLPSSQVYLKDVYENHHDLFNELTHEKFIIVGRKGAGKTAFAEYVQALSMDDGNLFCSFLKQDHINLETLVQTQANADSATEINKGQLFKWLILTNFLKLFFESEAAKQASEFELLQKFLRKNTGYIEIDKGEIVELVKKDGFYVSIEHFKRFFKGKFKRDLEIKESKAPYFRLLPHLEKVIVDVLVSELNLVNENSYVLFFDDLDIGFNASDDKAVDNLLELLRICKYLNNSVFAKGGTSAKVIILLRDDVERLISSRGADIAKLFSSYATHLNWYQEEYLKDDKESELGLKKLIVRRAKNAFQKSNIKMSKTDPWDSLISDDFSPKSSFKYIIDHTFLRPRDLILFFKPLEKGQYQLPLDKYDTNSLLGLYSLELIKELRNELSSFYGYYQIEAIFDALKEISKIYDCPYESAKIIIANHCPKLNASSLLKDLFERSVIGNLNVDSGHVQFKHKQTKWDIDGYSINTASCIIVHAGIKIYLQKR